MTNTSRILLKGSISRVVLLVANVAIGFFMLPFLIHSFGDEIYGLWVFVGSFFAFYSLMDLGMSSGMNRFLIRAVHGDDANDINITLSTSMAMTLCISLASVVVSVLIYIFAEEIAPENADIITFKYLVAVLGIKAAVTMPFTIFYAVLEAKYRYDIISGSQLISLIGRTLLVVFFVMSGYSIVSVAVITTIAELISSIVIVYFALRYLTNFKLSLSLFRIKKFKSYFHFGKFIYLINIAEKIKWSIDDIVIGVMVSLSAVTHYTIALTLVQYLGGLIGSAIGVVNPLFHKYHRLEQWDNLKNTAFIATEIASVATVLIGGLLVIFGDIFISLWVGDGFGDVYFPLLILLIATVAESIGWPGHMVLVAMAKHKYVSFLAGAEVVVNVSLSLILVNYMGISGVALGTAIPSILVTMVLKPLYLCKELNIPYWYYYRYHCKSIVLGVIVLLPCYLFLQSFNVDSYTELMLIGFMISVVYIVVSLKLFLSEMATVYLLSALPNKAFFVVKHLMQSKYIVNNNKKMAR